MTTTAHRDLSRRERQILDILYQKGRATAAEVQADLPEPPSYSAVRALLRILEDKGHVRHEQDGPRYVYLPTVARDNAKRSALRHILQTFFDGSAEQAISALLDEPSTRLSERRARPPGDADRRRAEERGVVMHAVTAITVVARRHRQGVADPGGDRADRDRVLRRASAAARHMIWTLGLMGALIVPALALALPRWEVPLVRLSTDDCGRATARGAFRRRLPPRLRITGRRRRRTMPRRAPDPPTRRTAARALPSWSTSLLLIWSIGALLIVGRMLVGLVAVQWMSRRTALVTDAPWLAQARCAGARSRPLARSLSPHRTRPRCRWRGASCVRPC